MKNILELVLRHVTGLNKISNIISLKIPLLFFIIILFYNSCILADQKTELIDIWDIKLGMHYTDIPSKDFMFFACGTNGGPPSRPLVNKFADYHLCEADNYGLREVYLSMTMKHIIGT